MFDYDLIKIFLASMTPVGELRLAIPLGLIKLNKPWWSVYLLAVIGNSLPPFFILWLFPKISEWLMKKSKLINRFLNWLYNHTRRKTRAKIEKYGAWALISFVAIPLPYTGAWTGALAAWLFDMPMKRALPNIIVGIFIAGTIITLITLGLLRLT